jgi:hypothetical protein
MNPGISDPNPAPAPSRAKSTRPRTITAIPNETARCRPSKEARRGESTEKTAMHSAIGTKDSPAFVGENPRMSCRYSEVKK